MHHVYMKLTVVSLYVKFENISYVLEYMQEWPLFGYLHVTYFMYCQ